MDFSWAHGILDWLSANPGWTTAFIFFVALCEGVVVAGLVVPGATLLFVAGALVGTGHVELWPSLIAAFFGAFIGDSISYLLGKHYGDRLRTYWPLRRYPRALAKGDEFFAAHGGKSLVFGRFVGPVRGIIPAIAGMMGMPPRPFFIVNFFSALFWAPAYLLPGMVFGASLAVAASVAVRLVALLLLVLVIAWGGWWLIANVLAPRLRSSGALIAWRARNWGRYHPLAAQALSGPRYALRAFSYSAGWVWWAALAGLVALAIYQAVLGGPTLLDEALLGALVTYTSVELRGFFILPSLLLEPTVWVPALLGGVLWVAGGGRWRGALVLVLIVSASALVAVLMGLGLSNWSTIPLYRGAPLLGFPSPEVAGFTSLVLAVGVLATVVYGPLRWPVLIVGVIIPLLAALSGVIVGRLWFVDALGGLLLGVVMAGLVIMARSSAQRRLPERTLPAIVAGVLVAAVAFKGVTALPDERERFVVQAQAPQLTTDEWLEVGPAESLGRELRWLDGGRRPVDIQWLAEIEAIKECLEQAGWVEPDRRLHGVLRWFQPDPEVEKMLPVARWHRGRLPDLIRVQQIGDDQRLVLRLWLAPVEMVETDKQVWLTTLELETVHSRWPVANVKSEQLSLVQRQAAVNDMLRAGDVPILEPGQPVRIVPLQALQ
ncbi:VTT domain-containing protein [Halorhodospira halochloris]|uniref:DedA protein n=1 Tax=Halorhodospira halochloris TaxID=1052 RepID=A0A0X8XAF7_HALHR|nr:VTT domain-containing protein [Halorhodospira halochloris]MBK1652156.1 hypothetical protein [Halorhodospira halochloris]MCG5530584.1 VTT domain-containing protein [Halorhodospira halochloris]BAU58426.1 DedA protein [Halorhodospira halochloris]